jgi:hypothetical protein
MEAHFKYLDALRESGSVNMFGAGANLREMFNLDKREARTVLKEWMRTFEERQAAKDAARSTMTEEEKSDAEWDDHWAVEDSK